jgi:hypothetical protein
MMKKNILVLMLCGLSAMGARGQSNFNHAIGLSLYGYDGIPALTYSPRWNIQKWNDNTTLSIGTHFGLNFGIYTNDIYVLDIPIMMELNFGHGSHSQNEHNVGQFIGLGYGYSEIDEMDISDGIVFNAGIRKKLMGESFGLRVSYLYNLRSTGGDVFSFGLFYTFSQTAFSRNDENKENSKANDENKENSKTPKFTRKKSLLQKVLGL